MKIRNCISSYCLLVGLIVLAVMPAYATFPGMNGRIIFGRFDPNLGDFVLYTANSDGTDVQQLTHVPSHFSDWRADGNRIAFDLIDPAGNVQIATINPDGSGFQQITSGEVPSWSPDGTQIVFDYSPTAPDDPSFHTSIYLVNSDGSNPHALTFTPDTFDVEPRFSPDGSKIVFVRIRKVAGNGFQQEAVVIMNSDGTGVRQLTSDGIAAEHPTWSPDSQWIVFNVAKESGHPAGSSLSIYLVRPDGTDQHLIYNGRANLPAHKPQFSPDGTKILFGCFSYTNGSPDICVMNADGSNVVDIISTPNFRENFPSWGVAPE
jgi:Tol biopolymer transport system component